jgi:hypothetical protein
MGREGRRDACPTTTHLVVRVIDILIGSVMVGRYENL